MFEEFEEEIESRTSQGFAWVQPEAFDPSPPRPGTVVLSGFAAGSAKLLPTHRRTIVTVANRIRDAVRNLNRAQRLIVEVEGHEDETGDPAHFTELGWARAIAVEKALKIRLTAVLPAASRPRVRFRLRNQGPRRPIRSNVTPRGRAMNRRVEIRWQTVAPRTQIA